jgi:hypothetical protein
MKESLLKTVSMQELQEMRNSGLSNMEIAQRLDVGYSTICRYLGRNESLPRAPWGSLKKKATTAEKPVQKQPVLKCVSRILEYEGQAMRYVVLPDNGTVRISTKPGSEEPQVLDKNGLETFITELIDLIGLLES